MSWIILIIFIVLIILIAFFLNKPSKADNISFEIFELINDLRINNNLSSMEFNYNAYEMAIFIANESYKGRETKDYNALAMRYDLSNVTGFVDILENDKNTSTIKLVQHIISIKPYKDKILNKMNKEGAVGCYKNKCAIIMIQNNKTSFLSSLTSNKKDSLNNYQVSQYQPDSDSSEEEVSSGIIASSIDISDLERDIHDLINQERRNKGLRSLSFDLRLSDIARDHSKDMSQNNFFEHINLRGQDPTDRASAKGYYCRKDFGDYYMEGIAENLFQNNLYDSITYINLIPFHDWNTQSEIAESTVQGWMNSPGHRQNILTADYDSEGIGVVISYDDKVYITQDFC
ncbi:MAG TPA: CAP domain-containing protein [Candidatus Nanoarchaeia archaeon]|nr:CAP domain-containing protein [Candidatus Nanoarchaeia archaeon]